MSATGRHSPVPQDADEVTNGPQRFGHAMAGCDSGVYEPGPLDLSRRSDCVATALRFGSLSWRSKTSDFRVGIERGGCSCSVLLIRWLRSPN